MVCDLAHGLVFLSDEPDGSRLMSDGPLVCKNGGVHRQRLDLASGFRRGGETLGFVLGLAGQLKHL